MSIVTNISHSRKYFKTKESLENSTVTFSSMFEAVQAGYSFFEKRVSTFLDIANIQKKLVTDGQTGGQKVIKVGHHLQN